MLNLPDAQRELPTLAAKTLRGEEVLIVVGEQRLRLAPAAVGSGLQSSGKRPRRGDWKGGDWKGGDWKGGDWKGGDWKGRVTIPDAFYQPWDAEDIGETGA